MKKETWGLANAFMLCLALYLVRAFYYSFLAYLLLGMYFEVPTFRNLVGIGFVLALSKEISQPGIRKLQILSEEEFSDKIDETIPRWLLSNILYPGTVVCLAKLVSLFM